MKTTALFLSVYLFAGSLFPRTDFSQLLRLASVAEHYRFHQAEARLTGDSVSMWQFLKVHFITPDGHEHDPAGQAHHQLPFYSVCHCHVLTVQRFEWPGLLAIPHTSPTRVFHYLSPALRDHSDAVFHPPLAA